ncbi:MAG TPA: haloalkane dehalogenase [Solirubrobacterales bacterium]
MDKRRVEVLGSTMAYVDAGAGPLTFLLLHGNPTSSYLWRGVIPHLTPLGRCVAPDLIGMGDSAKLPDSGPERYTFVEHRRYLDALLEALDLGDSIVLVVHDWGSALGFDWARRNPERVAGIAYMEAIVRPLRWDEWPEEGQATFQRLRSADGEKGILEKNLFVEGILPSAVLRELSKEEMDEYRRPFAEPGEGRRPTLTWPRQIPIEGQPAEVVAIVAEYFDWLAASPVPKLFINADPGSILVGAQRETCREWPNQTEVTVAGLHFVQEDSPKEIGSAIAGWASEL